MPTRKIWGIMVKDYLEGRELLKPISSWTYKDVNSERGTEQFIDLAFEKTIFNNPKPIGTIKRCMQLSTTSYDIVLDFFSGSGTTAHAVMQLNTEDDGKRKFILVQLPEVCQEDSAAAQKPDTRQSAKLAKNVSAVQERKPKKKTKTKRVLKI